MKKELWLIFLIAFIDLLGFGIVIPTLPFIAEHFGASALQIGILAGSYSLFQFIGSPILGRLSDKYGRKPLLSLSLFGTSAGYFLIAVAGSLPLVFLSRVIDGLTGGNISVAQAYIADVTEGKERTKAMGLLGSAFGMGFIFGPLIGAVLTPYGFALPYIFAGILAFLNGLLIMIILPESERKTTQQRVGSLFSVKVLKEILRPQIVLDLTILFFLITFSFSLMQGIFPLYTNRLFRWDARHNGYFFAFIGVVSVLSQGVVLRRLVHKISERTIVRIALFSLTIGFTIFTFGKTQLLFFLGGLFLASSFGILNASIQAEISHFSNPEEQGIVMGVVQGWSALARAIGPVVGGLLFGSLFLQAPFLLSAILLFVSALISLTIYKKSNLE